MFKTGSQRSGAGTSFSIADDLRKKGNVHADAQTRGRVKTALAGGGGGAPRLPRTPCGDRPRQHLRCRFPASRTQRAKVGCLSHSICSRGKLIRELSVHPAQHPHGLSSARPDHLRLQEARGHVTRASALGPDRRLEDLLTEGPAPSTAEAPKNRRKLTNI